MTLPVSSPPPITRASILNFLRPDLIRSYFLGFSIFLTFTRELLEGQHVRLEFDNEKKDDDYFTLAYVFLKDKH